jgi:gamma-glutamylcysteine synthetase
VWASSGFSDVIPISISRGPRVLAQNMSVNVKFLLAVFKEGPRNIFDSKTLVKYKKYLIRCKYKLVCYLLGVSPALEMEQIESSETSANKNPKDSTLNIKHGESLKSEVQVS